MTINSNKITYFFLILGALQTFIGFIGFRTQGKLPITEISTVTLPNKVNTILTQTTKRKKNEWSMNIFSNLARALAETNITEVTMLEEQGLIFIDLGENAFKEKEGKTEISESAKLRLKKVFPVIAPVIKKSMPKKIKLLGMEGQNQKNYSFSHVKEIYRYVFNVQNLDFNFQDYLFARTSISGNGNLYLQKALKETPIERRLKFTENYASYLRENGLILKLYEGGSK